MGIPAVPRRSGRYPGLAAFRRFCESSPGISLSQCDGLACRRTIQKVSQGLIQTLYFRMSEPLSYPVMQALFDSANRLCKTAPFIAQGQDNLATVAGIFAANDPTPPDRCRNQTAWASMLANQPAPQFPARKSVPIRQGSAGLRPEMESASAAPAWKQIDDCLHAGRQGSGNEVLLRGSCGLSLFVCQKGGDGFGITRRVAEPEHMTGSFEHHFDGVGYAA